MPTDAHSLLQFTARAGTVDEYLQLQSDCVRSLAGQEERVCSIAGDEAAPLARRFEALQVLFWWAPGNLDSFLNDLCASAVEPAVAEAARAVLFRSRVRRNVATDQPDRLNAYLDATRREFAKWRFSGGSYNG